MKFLRFTTVSWSSVSTPKRRPLAASSFRTLPEKPSQGEITAVGPGGRDEAGKLIPIDLKVGDRVLFGKWSGTEVKLDGQELLIMKENDIMGFSPICPPLRRKPRKRASQFTSS